MIPGKISIIIPVFNHLEDNLKPCIESIKRHTDLNTVEVIVVANGCKDGTEDYVRSLGDPFKLLSFEEPIGYPRANNEGLKIAQGEYLLLLNDDTVILGNNWISCLKDPFLKDPLTGISGPVKFIWDCGGVEKRAIAFLCCMFKRSLIDEIGYLDEIFYPGMGEDGDYSIKTELAGYKLVQVPTDVHAKFGEPIVVNFPIMHKGNGTFTDKSIRDEAVKKNHAILVKRYGKNRLDEIYEQCLSHPSDINELFPVIRKYSSKCEHVTEMGVRGVFSTYAFLSSRPKKMISYDIETSSNINEAIEVAKQNNIDFKFIEQDVLTATIEETDLLFIDTAHTYKQLSQELKLHGNKSRKYIMLHDTFTFGEQDSAETDCSKKGLKLAIAEFTKANPHWITEYETIESNGLTILKRKQDLEHHFNNPNIKPKISIVVPTYNHLSDCLKPCLDSVAKYTNLEDVEVIVVANGCKDGTEEYVKSLGHPFKLVWFDEGLGFTKAANEGIKRALGEYVVLLNNDTVILDYAPKNTWINLMLAPFSDDDKVGITGPLELYDSYADERVMIFFCVCIKKKLFDEIGLLDESYSPGGGEDICFSVEARLRGYKQVVVPGPTKQGHTYEGEHTNSGDFPIYHKGEGTFSETEFPEYGKRIIKDNGMKNMIRYNKNIRLNLGSGGVEVPGYISVDKYDHRASIIMDVCNLELPDGSVQEILASHLFEHINPYHALDLLKKWFRVLKPGGKLVMELPNLEELCKEFVKVGKGEKYGVANCIYGSVNTKDNKIDEITAPHLFGWWPEVMVDHLTWAGFSNIVILPEQIPHPVSHCNMRVEATKPL